ncbi:MAG TPA: S9 family peptidase [Dokdonella sp.]
MRSVDKASAAVLAAFLAVASAHAQVPLADFARAPQFRDIKISPQGDYLAASAVVDGKAVLSLIHLDGMKGVNLRPRDLDEIADFWWAAPHRLVYSVSQKTGGLEQPVATGELFAVNADGSSQKMLAGFRVKGDPVIVAPILPLFSDDRRVLISASRWTSDRDGSYPTAAWLDLDSGSVTRIVTAPIRNAQFVADNDGDVRFASAQGTDQAWRVYYREKKGEWELLFDESKHHFEGFPVRFGRSGSEVYVKCAGSRSVDGLCRWNVATRTLTAVWSDGEVVPDELLPTFDEKDAFAIRSTPGRPQSTLIDASAPEAKLLAAMSAQFPGEYVRFTSHTRDGRKVVVLVAAADDPGSFYLYDADARKAGFLFARMPWIKPEAMSKVEPIVVKARDGTALHGYLARPQGREQAKGLPLVVYVHGGPFGVRDLWEFDPTVQALASRGYAVLQVNYRGSGGYGGAFERAGYREWGGRMQDDVTDATRWAIEQGIADPKRVCSFGASYGGYAALEGAVKEPDLYRCAIGYVGVYDLTLMYRRGDVPQSKYGENYLKRVLGEDEAVLWDRSPIAHLDRLHAKVMLIVGGADTRVPPIYGENLHYALDKAHVEHEWLYRRTEGHGFYEEANRTDLLERVVAFLDRNIGAAAH